MAKTADGKKIVPVDSYKRRAPSSGGKGRKTQTVKKHKRSTPN